MLYMSDYVTARVIGPLSHQYPFAMPPHDSGNLNGRRPNPPLFSPSNNSSEYANSRYDYFRTLPSSKPSTINDFYAYNKKFKMYGNTNASSLNTSRLKTIAIGKSSYKIGLPYEDVLTFRNYNRNDVKQALKRTRSSGCVPPKKVGAIENYSLKNPGICCLSSANILSDFL